MKKKVKRGLYFSYLFRTTFCFIAFLVSLITGIYLIINSINYNKTEKINYLEESKIDYKVYLKKNNFYETEYLEKDMLYIANLINKINIDFNYLFTVDRSQNIDFTYSIFGKLSIKNSQSKKTYYEKNYEILPEHSVDMIQNNKKNIFESVNIDYDYYNSLANDFKSSYGVDTESTLTVYMIMKKQSKDKNSFISGSNSIMNIIVPLSEKSVEIKLDYNEIKQKSGIVSDTETVSIDQIKLIIAIVLMVISIVYLIKFIRKISVLMSNNKFDKHVKKILKTYDRLIIESKNLISFDGKEVIKLSKFTELLDVHDNLQLPIMYCSLAKHIKCYFYILYNDIIYLYVVKAVDLGDNKDDK